MQQATVYMPTPDGKSTMPAPAVLDEAEAVRFLRLKSKNPSETMEYYRRTGMLRGTRIGTHVVYLLSDLMHFIAHKNSAGSQ